MASPTQGTTVPYGVTFTADGLTNKAGTLRGIATDENGSLFYVTYLDGDGGIRGITLKAGDITLAS